MGFLWIYKIPADVGRSEGGEGSGSLNSVEYQTVYPLGPEEKGRWHLIGTEEALEVEVAGTIGSTVSPFAGGGRLELGLHVNG